MATFSTFDLSAASAGGRSRSNSTASAGGRSRSNSDAGAGRPRANSKTGLSTSPRAPSVLMAASEPPGRRRGSSKEGIPETRGLEEGTSRRNIIRKGGKPGAGTKVKHSITDDGSSVLFGPRPEIDPGDPLYEPFENDDNYVLVSSDMSGNGAPRSPPRHNYDPEHRRIVFGPMLTLPEFKRRVTGIIKEYFSSEDVDEVIRAVQELRCPEYHYEVVKRSISMSMDRKERERELVSKLLSTAYPTLLTTEQLGKGFERLFEYMDDLELDAPGATEVTAAFLARAVVDEIIPPAFLVDRMIVSMGGDVVVQTKSILMRDHAHSRVERIWGPGDGRPVEELKVAIDQLLNEYLLSRQIGEAMNCVRELRVPHFNHELVKRAVVSILDKSEDDMLAMVQLLTQLHQVELLSDAQVEQGFSKLLDKINDLILDTPRAGTVITAFLGHAKASGMIRQDFVNPLEGVQEPALSSEKEPSLVEAH